MKKLDGQSKSATKLNAILIGQIGKNFAIEENSISLADILEITYGVIHEVRALIGGRSVIVECEDTDKLTALYKKHGFKKLEMNNDEDELITMYTCIKD